MTSKQAQMQTSLYYHLPPFDGYHPSRVTTRTTKALGNLYNGVGDQQWVEHQVNSRAVTSGIAFSPWHLQFFRNQKVGFLLEKGSEQGRISRNRRRRTIYVVGERYCQGLHHEAGSLDPICLLLSEHLHRTLLIHFPSRAPSIALC